MLHIPEGESFDSPFLFLSAAFPYVSTALFLLCFPAPLTPY